MTHTRTQTSLLLALLTGGLVLSGCVSNETKPAEPTPLATTAPPAEAAPPETAQAPVCKDDAPKNSKKRTKTTPNPACVKAAPAATATRPAAAAPVAAGGYDLSKNTPVTDSTKVAAGQGTQVKGINDWQGEITGVPVKGSRFTKLKIGMPMQQVFDLVGQPTDKAPMSPEKPLFPSISAVTQHAGKRPTRDRGG